MPTEDDKKPMPTHVAEQRAKRENSGPNARLRRRNERSEFYDVFRRIDMHGGDSIPCWEWRGAHGKGTRSEWRPRVAIGKKHYYVYRIVYSLYTGYDMKHDDVIRHSCDHSWCCNPHHMLIGKQADNVRDMLQRERVGMKLFYVKRIMQMLEIGCRSAYISAKMREGYDVNIDESMIRKIRLRTIYKHVEWPWGDVYAASRKARREERNK